jgi:hypothetical protein
MESLSRHKSILKTRLGRRREGGAGYVHKKSAEPNVSFIQKPFDPETLVATLRQVLEARRYQISW